ncbi:hypothetical protein QR680_002778 [Steinernema hermaphroditum]|uniref:Uncharacterized protein n=1 Tax=Steinernema hermaphroditum TaxID=289476 RepID=A0AA39H6P6_9BILA|nr:hypothetical protein QR680_002778 [Steinernema hermaphroditum]
MRVGRKPRAEFCKCRSQVATIIAYEKDASLSLVRHLFVDAALPILRQKMRLDNFYVDGVSINEKLGVFKHSINPEGHAVVSLFATGMDERNFAIQDDVQALCQNLIKRTHEAQALNTAPTSNQSRTEPHPPGSQLFKSLLFCLNEVSLPEVRGAQHYLLADGLCSETSDIISNDFKRLVK